MFFQCRTRGDQVGSTHFTGEHGASLTVLPCVCVCVSMDLQGTVCWTCPRAPCHCRGSCRASSTAWTSSASRYLERSSLIAPTSQTAAMPAASCGARRTARRSAPPKTAAYPGPTARRARPTGPACTGSACPPRR